MNQLGKLLFEITSVWRLSVRQPAQNHLPEQFPRMSILQILAPLLAK